MKKKTVLKAVSIAMGTVLACGTFGFLSGCVNKTKKPEVLVLMTEELNGLFNPFFSTSATDGTIVAQTQLSMLTTNEGGEIDYGEGKATVVLDCDDKYDPSSNTTTYRYVIKNGLKFSDNEPLTMNDIMFNFYVYLDPAYTGSTTMYSTDIVGLQKYRTQSNQSGSGDEQDKVLNEAANNRARNRVNELIELYKRTADPDSKASYDADEAKMKEAIDKYSPSAGYKNAIAQGGVITDEKAREQLKKDYEQTLEYFREELQTDYNGAKDAYKEEPYKSAYDKDNPTQKGFDEVTSFMFAEGYVTPEYERDSNGKLDTNKMKSYKKEYASSIDTEEKAINFVYEDKVTTAFHQILTGWGTANTMLTEFVAKAKDVILHEGLKGGELAYKSIDGIVSLGHEQATKGSTITLHEGDSTKQKDYVVASDHEADGRVKGNGYDVLSITINGQDPKAEWNFGIAIAPHHYYSDTTKYPVNIEKEQYGVDWASFDFMKDAIQGKFANGVSKNRVPMGAGPYMATDSGYVTSTPANEGFLNSKVVYFKANEHFHLGKPKIEKMCYQTISSNNALGKLEEGTVHFVEPQFTMENSKKLQSLENKGFKQVDTWQLGYGYIGINAGKVPNIYLRQAIMAAMDVSLATSFYSDGTAVNIAWPMSVVGWAYPRRAGTSYDAKNPTLNMETNNTVTYDDGTTSAHDYTKWTGEADAKTKIKDLMAKAGVQEGDSELKLKFTIAGSDINEHPTFNTFNKARRILNECGWQVEVQPDLNALVKLSTGSLAVWAAAWGSTIDPDMYQVYHKNSSATSVLAWGYREILSNVGNRYSTENRILNELSALIDQGREHTKPTERAGIYKQAMGKVLDLAIELPVYQRKVLYAYNANVIKASSLPATVNPYTSPLEKIWEIEFAD